MSRFNFPRRVALLAVPAAVLAATAVVAGSPGHASSEAGPLVVHEWGTFLSVQGSDGIALGGMVASEEKLPNFVREQALAGRNRACLNCKMETPVTYFYVDRPRTVEVRVAMRNGLLSHWYPAVESFGKVNASCKAASADTFLDWGRIELMPDRSALATSLPAARSAIAGLRPISKTDTWGFVRQTDSALVKVAPRTKPVVVRAPGEVEKFLFYRGLGEYTMPLQAIFEDRKSGTPALVLHNRDKLPLRGVFCIQVNADGIHFEAVPDIAGKGRYSLGSHYSAPTMLSLSQGVPAVKEALANALVQAGLFLKEAQAMVNNWEHSYFRTEGLRILYVVPRPLVDEIIPLQIKPIPDHIERVMVGRVEVLTPQKERRLAEAVRDMDSPNSEVRNAARAELGRLGRLQEPALRRIARTASALEVRQRAEALVAEIGKSNQRKANSKQ